MSPLATSALPANFPQAFLPARDLLARLLAFTASGGGGDKQAISAATGIPTGQRTGKVEPMIHYARGMGLITAEANRGHWRLQLTTLGGLVQAEDRFLSEAPTLWAMHLLLCRRAGPGEPARGLADPWFALFASSARLGARFDRAAYHAVLTERVGAKGYLRPLSGLVPRCYTEPACLGPLATLTATADDQWQREPAPSARACLPAYALALFAAWDLLYPGERQVNIEALASASSLRDVLHWEPRQFARLLDWMAERHLLQIDRLTGSAMALRLVTTGELIGLLYSELV